MSWKLIKNSKNTILFQRRDLPHHIISAYRGDNFTWWSASFYNVSYMLKMGNSRKNIFNDVIVQDIDAVYRLVDKLREIKTVVSKNELKKLIAEQKVVAVGKKDYQLKESNGFIPRETNKPVVNPYEIKKKNRKNTDNTGKLIADVIRQMMQE